MPLSDVYRSAFDASPNPCMVLDRTLHVVAVNPAWLAMAGRALADVAGRHAEDVLPADPAVRRQMLASIGAALRSGRPDTLTRLRLDGRYWTVTHTPVRDAGGDVALVLQHPVDVTGLQEQVAQLERAERRLAFQLELADRFRTLASAEAMVADASRLLGERLGLARVVFAEVAPHTMRVTVRRDWCRPGLASVAGIDTTLDDFGPGMADDLRAGRAVLVRDAHLDARTAGHQAAYEAIGVRAHLTLPLLQGGRVRVVLSLHDSVPRDWDEDALRMAEDMAARTWAAVESAGAQAELRAERDQSQSIFDSMTEGFALMDRDWTIVRMNAAGLQLVGLPEAEVVGRNHWKAFPDTIGSEVERLCRGVKAGAPAGSVEYAYAADGQPARWIEVRAFPALDGGLAVFFRDVTARRDTEDRLRRTAGHLRFTLDAARLGDWDLDLVTGGSQRSLLHDQLFGYGAPVAVWNADIFLAHVHPDDRARVAEEFRAAVASAGAWESEARVVWPDGSEHWLAFSGTVYLHEGRPCRMAGIVYDISERKRIEEQLRPEGHRKDEFLAMLAHELRNPLAPIGAAADLLSLGRLDPSQVSRTSAIIGRQVGHMTSLIDDLLDVSRVTRGLVTLASEPVAVADIVADAVEQVRPLIEARRQRLALPPATHGARVPGDRKRLVQVLANLLNNAAKYTPEGGHIEVRLELAPAQAVLTVTDDGIGMQPEVQRGAFDLFTQAERTPDRSQGGLGIGLALVKSLVELHRGSVAVYSEGPGKGSRFTVRLPRLPSLPAAAAAAHEPGPGVQGKGARPGRSVLVVDDNVDAAQLLAMVLESAGHRVCVEHHSHLALELARTTAPAVCILDIGLPEMDGNALARRLRQLPQMRGALLIAVTGYGRAEDRAAALAAGFDHHLVKPVDVQVLLKLLE